MANKNKKSLTSLEKDECDHGEYEEKVKLYKKTTEDGSTGFGKVHQIVNDYLNTGVLEEVCAENADCKNTEARDQQTFSVRMIFCLIDRHDSYIRKLRMYLFPGIFGF